MLAATVNAAPGYTLSPDDIERLTGLKRGVYPWQKLMDSFRSKAYERGQFFAWRQAGNSYVVLTPDETALECHRRQKIERRAARRTGAIAELIDDEGLSPHAAALKKAVVVSAGTIAKNFDDALRERTPMLKAFEPHPRIRRS